MLDLLRKKDPLLLNKDEPVDDIALVHCPVWGVESPPIGLGYISSMLNQHMVHPLVVDLNLIAYRGLKGKQHLWQEENQYLWLHHHYYSKTILPLLQPYYDKLTACFAKHGIRFFGFSLNTFNWHASLDVIRAIRREQPEAIIIGGGPLWRYEDQIPKEGDIPQLLDGYVIKEGEQSLLALYQAFRNGQLSTSTIPGYYDFKRASYQPYKLIADLNTIPIPTYRGFPLSHYTGKILNLTTSRGCVGQCTFCSDRQIFPGYRYGSAQRMMKEVEHHYTTYGIRRFAFNDLAINCNRKRLEAFCNLVIERRMNIEWYCLVLLKTPLPLNTLEKMKKAGCYSVTLGLESASDRVLGLMNKQRTALSAEELLCNAAKASIKVNVHIIVGYPGEEEEDFLQTYDFVEQNAKHINEIISVNICDICSTQQLLDQAVSLGVRYPEESKYWYMKGNNFRIRTSRLQKLIKLIKRKNITLLGTNIHQMQSLKQIEEEVNKSSLVAKQSLGSTPEKRNLLNELFHDGRLVYPHGKNVSLKTRFSDKQEIALLYQPLEDTFDDMWAFVELKELTEDWSNTTRLVTQITSEGKGGQLQVIFVCKNGSEWKYANNDILLCKGTFWLSIPIDACAYGHWSAGPPEKDLRTVTAWNIGINSIPETPAEKQTLTVHKLYWV